MSTSIRPLLLPALLLLWACGPPTRSISVSITLAGLWSDVDHLLVQRQLDGDPLSDNNLAGTTTHLDFEVPAGARRLLIDVSAHTNEPCRLAVGREDVGLDQAAERIERTLFLTRLPARVCAIEAEHDGPGQVLSMPSGIACGPHCRMEAPVGAHITLQAQPDADAIFTGWTGACLDRSLTCQLVVGGPSRVRGRFLSNGLTVRKLGRGGGQVVSDPPGLTCGATCSKGFPPGTKVRLRAAADPDAEFTGWSAPCSGTGACEIMLDSPIEVGASFTPRRICAPSGFCWENPLPQGNALNAVWGTAQRDIWAVGDAGTIFHFNGAAWTLMALGGRNITGLWGRAPDEIYAADGDGLLMSDGRGPFQRLHWGISALALWGKEGDLWAAGHGGAVMRLRGGSRERLDTGRGNATLTALWGSAANDLWAVGTEYINGNTVGLVLHFDGTAWRLIFSGANVWPRAIGGTSADDVWVVGSELSGGAQRQLILRGDLRGLSRVPTTARTELQGVQVVDSLGLVLAGDEGLLRWSGTALVPLASDREIQARAVFGAGTEIWAVGRGGAMHRWDRAIASFRGLGSGETFSIQGLSGSDPDHVWAVGTKANKGAILRRGDSGWRSEAIPALSGLRGLWAGAKDDVWAVGYGAVHFDGASWTAVPGPVGEMAGVWGSGKDDVWAVGGSFQGSDRWAERIYHYDGRGWTQTTTGAALHLWSIWGSGKDDIWVVSGDTAISGRLPSELLHYDGRKWTPVRDILTDSRYALWGSGARDVWACGASCFRFDGTSWSKAQAPASTTRLWGSGPRDLWSVSYRVERFDGTGWSLVDVAAGSSLRAIWGTGRDVWIAGDEGAILHATR